MGRALLLVLGSSPAAVTEVDRRHVVPFDQQLGVGHDAQHARLGRAKRLEHRLIVFFFAVIGTQFDVRVAGAGNGRFILGVFFEPSVRLLSCFASEFRVCFEWKA